jgi:hypothetical protein
MTFAEFIHEFIILRWKMVLLSAVVGAVTLILLSETLRWWLGKGFFQ